MILPAISTGQKPCLAGTYVAEQTSKTSCELVSVTSPKSPKGPSLFYPNEKRRRRKDENKLDKDGAFACTILPALNTIEPLLLRTSEGFFQPHNRLARKGKSKNRRGADQGADKSLPDIQQAALARASEMKRAICRLHKGMHATSPTGDDSMDQTDSEAVAQLTRPRTGSKLARAASRSASKSPDSSKRNAFGLSATSDCNGAHRTPRGKKKHANHYDLFASVLGVSNDNSKSPRPNLVREDRKSDLMVSTISILPENAVDFFFEEEERIMNEKAAQRRSSTSRALVGSAIKQNKKLMKMGSANAMMPAAQEPEVAAESERKATVMSDWNEVLEAIMPIKKIDKVRQQACEALRLLVFGAIGNENETFTKEKEKIFYESSGTYEKVVKLWKVWIQLDDDQSGRVDISEFRAYAEKVGQKKMGEKAMSALLGKKSSFTLEDMMCLIWPTAQSHDIAKMKQWIKEHVASMRRVPTPPILGQSEFEGLIENFRFFDADGSGYVSVEELTAGGLLDKDQALKYLSEWDDEGCGEFSEVAFCHMLCPTGYRAYADAPIATDKDGNQVVYEELFGWRLKHFDPANV